MQFSCDSCKAPLQIADEKVRGKRLIVRCRRCGAKIALADPAISRSSPRVISAPPGPAAGPHAAQAAQQHAPEPSHPPAAQAAQSPGTDTEITRSMETEVLERALQASSAETASRNGATAGQEPVATAPPADGAIWFAMLHGKQTGPMTRAELDIRADEGEVGPRTYLWREGMDSWQRAKDVPELSAMFPQLPGAAPSVPSAPTPAPRTPPAPARPAAQPLQQAAPAVEQLSPVQQAPPVQQAAPVQHPTPDPRPSWMTEDVLAAERAQAEQVARELFASGEHNISQKNAIDLARWATDELGAKKEPEPPRIVPPVVSPAPMFESTAPRQGKGAFVVFVGLALLAGAALVLWLLLGSAPKRVEEPPKPPETRSEPGAPAPVPVEPAPKAPEPQPPQARAPDPVPPPPIAGLTAEQVRRKLDEGKPALQKCIDDALRLDPKLHVGKIHVSTTIAPSGQVTAAHIDKRSVDESSLGTCLKRATRRIVFPPFAGAAFDVDIPIVVTAGD